MEKAELTESKIIQTEDLCSITTEDDTGNGQVHMFSEPIKYRDKNGKVQFINTAMKEKKAIDKLLGGYEYENSANDFTVSFSKKAKKGLNFNNVFTMSIGEKSNKSEAVISETEEGNGKIIYPNAFGESTAVEYINTSTGIKENIILEDLTDKNTFEFSIETKAKRLVLSEDGSMIYVVDEKDASNINYVFQPLYAYDAFQAEDQNSEAIEESFEEAVPDTYENTCFSHTTEECWYHLEEVGKGKYIITVEISKDFLSHPETVYPVVIDPTVNAVSNYSSIDDTYAQESSPNTNKYLASNLRVGYSGGRFRSYIRFMQMPDLSKNAIINDALLKVYYSPGQTTSSRIACYRITEWWSGSGLTWNSQPQRASEEHPTYPYVKSDNTLDKCIFSVGDIVRGWYDNEFPNYGLCLSYADEAYRDYNSFVSSDGNQAYTPALVIYYSIGETPGIPNNGVFSINSRLSGKCLDVYELKTNVVEHTWNGGTNQQWQFTYVSDGYYRLTPQHATNKGLDIQDGGNYNGANVQVHPYNGNDAQLFHIHPLSNGSFYIMPKTSASSKRVLDVTGPSTADGTNIQLWGYINAPQQQWYITPAGNNRTIFIAANFYYDNAFAMRFNAGTGSAVATMKEKFFEAQQAYYRAFNVYLVGNEPVLVTSVADNCKLMQGKLITNKTIVENCPGGANHSNSSGEKCTHRYASYRDLISRYPGSSLCFSIFWTGNKMFTEQGGVENRSFKWYNYGISMQNFSYSNNHYTLIHELAHEMGAPDHYHEPDTRSVSTRIFATLVGRIMLALLTVTWMREIHFRPQVCRVRAICFAQRAPKIFAAHWAHCKGDAV